MEQPSSNIQILPQSAEINTLEELRITKEELNQAKKEIEELKVALEIAGIDGLTGLFRREFLEPRLNKWVEELRIIDNRRPFNKVGFMVILVDVDDFKEYNSKYGHLAGDNALRELGTRFKKVEKRYGDFTCRLGGDEFVMGLSFESDKDVSDETVEKVFNRIKQEVNDNLFIEIAGSAEKRMPITVAMGFTFFRKGDATKTAEELVHLADMNQYLDKNSDVKRARMEKARKTIV
jgi:diguanylate cyclase (GGDEF)-like protein